MGMIDRKERKKRFVAWLLKQADRGVVLTVVFLVAAAVAVSLMYVGNQTDGLCRQCHHRGYLFEKAGLDPLAHEPIDKGEVRCIACHTDKDKFQYMADLARQGGELAGNFTTQEVFAAEIATGVKDDECLTCHWRILEKDRVNDFIDRPKLAEIGLIFDHQKHFALREFTDREQDRLRELDGKPELTETELDEKIFLNKVKISNCAICHQKLKNDIDGAKVMDKSVNHFTENPMSCFSCHTDADQKTHPGQKLEPPAERTCRKCHNGLLHGRIRFFRADKNDSQKTDCQKCHPHYRGQETVALDTGGN